MSHGPEMNRTYQYREKVHFACPECGRTESAFAIDTCGPNLNCHCQPGYVIIMQPLVFKTEGGEGGPTAKEAEVSADDPASS